MATTIAPFIIALFAGSGCTYDGTGGATADARIGDCSGGYKPVVTSSQYSPSLCTKDGVFLGCAPPHSSRIHLDIISVCDRPVFDPAYLYCLEGEENVAFYYSHTVDWCSESSECDGVELVTECDQIQ